MMAICYRWERFKDDVRRDPTGPGGFHATDNMIGWLEGYADFCEENGDPAMAREYRDLIYIVIQLARIIRLESFDSETRTEK